jgi:hypothetical protein
MGVAARSPQGRGSALLLAHCEVVARLVDEPRSDARERLAEALGAELAQRLVDVLAHARPLRTTRPWMPRLEVA